MRNTWYRYLQLKRFFALPWTPEARGKFETLVNPDPRIGSPDFYSLWEIEKGQKSPRDLLQLLIDLLALPELTGEKEQAVELLAAFYPDLAPHAFFWREIAELVNQAFPSDSLTKSGQLERKIHQLRYVISCQQAQYVRQLFPNERMTDAEKLATYLKPHSYTLTESARLHNKYALENGKKVYPDGCQTNNLKILQHFHTEFILSSQGDFLNEVDPDKPCLSGIVNGASFNYASANDQRHRELDILTVRPHDPAFRKEAMRGFSAPSLWEYRTGKSWLHPFRKSNYAKVQKEARLFDRLVKKIT